MSWLPGFLGTRPMPKRVSVLLAIDQRRLLSTGTYMPQNAPPPPFSAFHGMRLRWSREGSYMRQVTRGGRSNFGTVIEAMTSSQTWHMARYSTEYSPCCALAFGVGGKCYLSSVLLRFLRRKCEYVPPPPPLNLACSAMSWITSR